MNKSAVFKSAHAITKAVHVAGDCYRVTFGAAVKIIIAESKAAPKTLADRLIEAGAKVWTSPDGKINRVYVTQAAADIVFNGDILKGWNVARVTITKTANLFLDLKTNKLFSNNGTIRVTFNSTTHGNFGGGTGLTCGKA